MKNLSFLFGLCKLFLLCMKYQKNYQIVESLGQGSFGTVYRIVDQKGKSYALKKMLINPFMIDQAQNQINIMRALQHPNLVRVYQTHCDNQTMQIIMEYCQDGDLLQLYRKKKKNLSAKEILKIFNQIVKAFIAMNTQGVFHRDLKPENVLIGKQGVIKIADFGCAKSINSNDISTIDNFSIDKGTPIYSSPEQLMNMPYSAKCDVWSAGCLVYFLYYGSHPFMDVSIHHTIEKIRKMTQGKQQIELPQQKDATVSKLIKMTLKFQQKQRASWRQISLSRIFAQKIDSITAYLDYLKHVSIIANWIAKKFWSIRKDYTIQKNKNEVFAYFIIKFQYTCLLMANQIIEKNQKYMYLFDHLCWKQFKPSLKLKEDFKKLFEDNKNYYDAIRKSFQSKKQIFSIIKNKQPRRRDCFNDLDNSIRGAYKILIEVVKKIEDSSDQKNKIWVVMSRWINFERAFEFEKSPRVQKIISQSIQSPIEQIQKQIQKYQRGLIQ